MAGKGTWRPVCRLAALILIMIVGWFLGGTGKIVHADAVAQTEISEEGIAVQDAEASWTDSRKEIMTQVGKYVCNALVALIAAMLINYVGVMLSSQMRRTSDSELLEHTMSYYEINDPDAKYVSSVETYRPNGFVEIMKGLAVNPFERWK